MTLWPLAVYAGGALFLVGTLLLLSWGLGERHRGEVREEPYESGILPTGGGRGRFSVKFYLVAVFFVLFDLEAVFLFAWALVAAEVGWAGLVEALIFMGVLLAALLYLARDGALDWGPSAAGRREAGR